MASSLNVTNANKKKRCRKKKGRLILERGVNGPLIKTEHSVYSGAGNTERERERGHLFWKFSVRRRCALRGSLGVCLLLGRS